MTIRVAAVDNHEIVRDGIAARLQATPDLTVVASVATVEEMLDRAADVDVVLLDLMLEAGSSADLVPVLVEAGPRVLVYTSEERPVPLRRAVTLGASGVLLKSDSTQSVIEAVRDCVDGGFCCSGPMAHALLHDEAAVAELSPTQVQILQHLDEGLDYQGVAAVLGSSQSSVKTHLQRVRAKFVDLGLEPRNSHHLTHLASRQGHLR